MQAIAFKLVKLSSLFEIFLIIIKYGNIQSQNSCIFRQALP